MRSRWTRGVTTTLASLGVAGVVATVTAPGWRCFGWPDRTT